MLTRVSKTMSRRLQVQVWHLVIVFVVFVVLVTILIFCLGRAQGSFNVDEVIAAAQWVAAVSTSGALIAALVSIKRERNQRSEDIQALRDAATEQRTNQALRAAQSVIVELGTAKGVAVPPEHLAPNNAGVYFEVSVRVANRAVHQIFDVTLEMIIQEAGFACVGILDEESGWESLSSNRWRVAEFLHPFSSTESAVLFTGPSMPPASSPTYVLTFLDGDGEKWTGESGRVTPAQN